MALVPNGKNPIPSASNPGSERISFGETNGLRRCGYESQGSPRTKFLLSITPIKQWVAVGKDAFMCFMQRRF